MRGSSCQLFTKFSAFQGVGVLDRWRDLPDGRSDGGSESCSGVEKRAHPFEKVRLIKSFVYFNYFVRQIEDQN